MYLGSDESLASARIAQQHGGPGPKRAPGICQPLKLLRPGSAAEAVEVRRGLTQERLVGQHVREAAGADDDQGGVERADAVKAPQFRLGALAPHRLQPFRLDPAA